jgi:hypothetical protein
MSEGTISRPHEPRATARDERRTRRKWRRHETALFAASVSGGAWALIVGMAAIIL